MHCSVFKATLHSMVSIHKSKEWVATSKMPTGNGPRPTLLPKRCLGMSGRMLVVSERESVGVRLKAQIIAQAFLLPLLNLTQT